MKKSIKIGIIVALALALIVAMSVVISTGQKNKEYEEQYNFAMQLAKQEQGYEAAISTLQEIADDYPAAQELINKIRYAEGCKLFNRNIYDEAALKFAETDYDDARELEYACYFFEGIELISSGKDGRYIGEAMSYLKQVPASSQYGSSAAEICREIYDRVIYGHWQKGGVSITLGMTMATVSNSALLGVEQYQITYPYTGRIEGKYGSSSFCMNVEVLGADKISVTGNCSLCSLSGTYSRNASYGLYYAPQDVPEAPYLNAPNFVE